MFSPVSIAPAPNPRGKASMTKQTRLGEKDIPVRAREVIAVLTAVTLYVPNLFITLPLKRLDKNVQIETVTVTKLA